MSDHALEDPVRRAHPQSTSVPWHEAAWRQFRLERKMFWRNPSAAFFNFLLPLLFLALFGAIFSDREADLQVIVPGIAGMAVMSTTFSALAMTLTYLRESGVLKRVRGTPLPTSAYLAGLAGNAIANTALQVGLITIAGSLVFGLDWPQRLGRADRVRGARRDLLRVARGRALARDPQLRLRAGLRQRRVPAGDLHLRRLLRRRLRARVPARDRRGAAAQAPDRRAVGRDGRPAKGLADNASAVLVLALWSAAGIVLAVRGFSWESRRT